MNTEQCQYSRTDPFINVPDKEPVPVEIGGADDEVFGREFLWCRHVNDGKRAGLKSKGENHSTTG